MKFKDIKQGDTAYVQTFLHVGWSKRIPFWLPKKVERVTPKRFRIGRHTYRKEEGAQIGTSSCAYAKYLGDLLGSGLTVTDQTDDRDRLIANLDSAHKANSIIADLNITYTHPRLNEVLSKLEEIEALCD